MISHMVLTMAVPVLLVPPRALTWPWTVLERDDGSRGHTRVDLGRPYTPGSSRLFSSPIVAAPCSRVELWNLLTDTPLFRVGRRADHVGHVWMIFHSLVVVYLSSPALIGVDPSPPRALYPDAPAHPAGHDGFPRVLRAGVDHQHRPSFANWYGAMGGVPASRHCRTSNGGRHRVGHRARSRRWRLHHGRVHVEPQRCSRVPAIRSQGRARRRCRVERVRRVGEASAQEQRVTTSAGGHRRDRQVIVRADRDRVRHREWNIRVECAD